jgi:hypothetical protein
VVIADPPSSGAVKLKVSDPLLGVTFVFGGKIIDSGTVTGVPETAFEPTLWPTELTVLNLTLY